MPQFDFSESELVTAQAAFNQFDEFINDVSVVLNYGNESASKLIPLSADEASARYSRIRRFIALWGHDETQATGGFVESKPYVVGSHPCTMNININLEERSKSFSEVDANKCPPASSSIKKRPEPPPSGFTI